MNVLQAMADPALLGTAFQGPSWNAWRAILAGAFALDMSEDQAELFQRLACRPAPAAAVRELLVIAGRRGGKSRVAAGIAVFLALLRPWRLALGETGTVQVIAADRDQAKVAFRYCLGMLEGSRLLAPEIDATTADTIRLANGIEIAITTCDRAAVRGRTVVAAVCDELAFWPHGAEEVLAALRPGMAGQAEAMLLLITTAYSQRGPAYELFRRFYGVADPHLLVVRATTRELNPTIPQAFIDQELERDPQGASAEYLAVFRSDLEALLDAALLDRATRSEPRELPRVTVSAAGAQMAYRGALDVSGGRGDAAAASVAHREGDRVVIDAVRRWPAPHDPVEVAREVVAFFAGYGLRAAAADHYGAELARSIYSEAGLALLSATVTRSEAYLHVLPLFASGRIEIPDDSVLRAEFLGLERRTGRSGRDAVDHRPGAHDDVANACALAAWCVERNSRGDGGTVVFVDDFLARAASDLALPGVFCG